MVKKAFKSEQIINKLREAEVQLSQGATLGAVSRKLGVIGLFKHTTKTEQNLPIGALAAGRLVCYNNRVGL